VTGLAFLKHVLFCAALTLVSAIVVRAMIGVRLMDRPDPRKLHTTPVPKGGGVGIVAAFLLGIAVLYGFASFARIGEPYFRGVIIAATAIALVSFLDDIFNWRFIAKLVTQISAAALAVGSGLYVAVLHVPWLGDVDLGLWGPLATMLWLVFATNAMNFMDGMDGLAAGTSLVASLFLAAIAANLGGWFVYFAGLLLAAGLLGFLPFNFPRARIFMGDVGSQFCGFMLAVLGVAAARFEAVEMSFLIVPMLLAGISWDVAFTLVRRALAGENLAHAHRGHLYQLAQRCGADAQSVAMLHWGFAGWGGMMAIGFITAPSPIKPFFPLALLLPQLCWTIYVLSRARHTSIGVW